MTVLRGQRQSVNRFESFHVRERFGRERRLPLEGVERNPLQQISHGQIQIIREPAQDFYQALLHSRPDLDALDTFRLCLHCCYIVTSVTKERKLISLRRDVLQHVPLLMVRSATNGTRGSASLRGKLPLARLQRLRLVRHLDESSAVARPVRS